jgi:hypothetical protein
MVSLAVAALLHLGVENPSEHIVLATSHSIATLLLSRRPFSPADVQRLRYISLELQYGLPIAPGTAPGDPILASLLKARSLDDIRRTAAESPLNIIPPTDYNPYFFNMLRIGHLAHGLQSSKGVLRGNMIATLTLIALLFCLFIIAVGTIIVPLASAGDASLRQLDWWSAAYFSLIGAGFMFVEIALIQRLSVFLGHPVYALGILLFTIIASAGAGSFFSEYFPLDRAPWCFAVPCVIVSLVVGLRWALPLIASAMVASPMITKIIVSIATITPVGLALGVCFPTGMRMVRAIRSKETPWYWALNGVFGVLCSALAVFVSIYFGISKSLFVGAACYALLILCIRHMTAVSTPGTQQTAATDEMP